jgi:choline dehydrogenase-like flavoprotein
VSTRLLGERLLAAGAGVLRLRNRAIYRETTGGGHTMGTTRMGHDPRTSVCDGRQRVHGYDNLYLSGSSVFPAGGAANPTLTIVALALRLGAHLRERLA